MTIDELIAVLQSAKSGKKTQWLINEKWQDFNAEEWVRLFVPMRVKPEPREWWLCNGKDRNYWIVVDQTHDQVRCEGEKVHVREVLE